MYSNSYATIVSDNDGSAFVTKAEFDALKSNFQSQIDSYNSSIDSKIDGAIVSYLSGIKISKTQDRSLLVGDQGKKLTFFNSNVDQDLAYKYAPPRVTGNTMTADGGVFQLWSFATEDYSAAPEAKYIKKQVKYTKDETGGKFFNPGSGRARTQVHYIPMLGFERTYLTNWGQIYNEDFDNYITAGATSVITDASGKKHMSMTNGVPFITLASGEEMEYTFKGTSVM